MDYLIQSLLGNIVADAYGVFDSTVKLVLENSLNIETLINTIFGIQSITSAYNFIYLLSCALLAIKFMQRGFSIYILWRDGDADSSPRDMVMGIIQAIVVAASFPYLYSLLTDVLIWFYESLLGLLNLSNSALLSTTLKTLLTGGIFQIIIVLIYVIAGFILWLHTMKRGFELFVLRMALPIACVGLVNSDGGVFKPYVSTIFKSVLTLIVQSLLMSLSLRMVTSLQMSGIFVGIAALMTAYSVPQLFQQFLVSGQGANVTNKIYSAGRLIGMAGGMLKK